MWITTPQLVWVHGSNGPEPTATAVFVVEAKVSYIGASKVNKGRDSSASGSGRPMVCRGGNSDGEEAKRTRSRNDGYV